AVKATCASSATSPSSLLPPTPAAAGTEAAGLGVALLAAAAEDVAVQVACALMAARLAQGEPAKALSVGVRVLASRKATISAAAAAAQGTAADPDTSAS
ncbi:unnamed protein product, partial [Ectocarpus sp. 8 AP-2014]